MKLLAFLTFSLLSLSLAAQFAAPCSEVPAINQQILDVLKPYIGKKIDRGECWDAAKLALDKVNADWDGLYKFGRVIDTKKECIQPGDIVQFEKAEFKIEVENGYTSESFAHHTAIVYAVNGPGELQLMHQNTGYAGKKMAVSSLNLNYRTKGKVTIYRPVPRA